MARKASNPMIPKIVEYRCNLCGLKEEEPYSFYRSYSKLYGNNGYMPVCKDCFAEVYNRYLVAYHDIDMAVKRICMAYDLYYSQSVLDACKKATLGTPPIGHYVRKLNLTHCKGKTFDSTLDEGFSFTENGDKKNQQEEAENEIKEEQERSESKRTRGDPTIPRSLIERWGTGFSKDEYNLLETHYNYLKKANPNCDENQEIFIIDLCYIKMQQMDAMHSHATDDFNKLSDSYRKTFTQAGLKTVRESGVDDEFSLGVTAQMIEQYTPAEYYKDKKRYKDFDGLDDYISRIITRPLKNLMFGTTDRDSEYYVKDEEDINEDE